ncbi:MAG: ErfK/YbiS/YcfS/YnhG family protein [Frankiales bacterium]|nr:ErfK/YbiS/YcfS/YnhG family protein [Frankiales bacterium]
MCAAAVLLAGCGHSAPRAVVAPSPTPSPTRAPVAIPTTAAPVVPDPLRGGDIAALRSAVTVYDSPSGRAIRSLGVLTDLDGPQALLVAGYEPGWVQVKLPMRPNDATGWVRASQVVVRKTDFSIQVVLARHQLLVRRGGAVVAHYLVATGASRTPTPTGLFYVTDLILTGDPAGAFGPAALGLSGRSDVITQFAGADGVLGIHGTSAQYSIGQSVSHGCIRMRNADSLALEHTVPVGTPVVIT